MGNTGKALLGKQMEGEPPVDVSSDKLKMKVSCLIRCDWIVAKITILKF